MPQRKQANDAQLRLLLPKEWVAELDSVAREHFQSRLALIREYIRAKLDDDLSNLDEKIAARQRINSARIKIDNWLEAELRRKEEDEW